MHFDSLAIPGRRVANLTWAVASGLKLPARFEGPKWAGQDKTHGPLENGEAGDPLVVDSVGETVNCHETKGCGSGACGAMVTGVWPRACGSHWAIVNFKMHVGGRLRRRPRLGDFYEQRFP